MTNDLQQARIEAAAKAFRNSEASAKATTPVEVSISAALAAADALLTRELIADALAEPGAIGVQSHDLRQADRVLALIRGEALSG